MAHEIQSNDGLVLAGKSAWHGLGTVVQSAPTPHDALRLAGLEWTVEQSDTLVGIVNPGSTNEFRISTDAGKILFRSDDRTVLGIVGPDFTPIQNAALADLAYALRSHADGTAEVESAGSIRGGRKVWMLLRGASVDMSGLGDESVPYLFIANGHDGTQSFCMMPTGVRVVCSNTFHLALGSGAKSFAFRHTSGITARVEDLQNTIAKWRHTIDKGSEVARALAARPMTREDIQSLWVEVIQELDNATIPVNPTNKWEQNRKDRAVAALAHMTRVFDTEAGQFGANAWIAANAATNYIQHERSKSLRDSEGRVYSAWAGRTAEQSNSVFDKALALV